MALQKPLKRVWWERPHQAFVSFTMCWHTYHMNYIALFPCCVVSISNKLVEIVSGRISRIWPVEPCASLMVFGQLGSSWVAVGIRLLSGQYILKVSPISQCMYWSWERGASDAMVRGKWALASSRKFVMRSTQSDDNSPGPERVLLDGRMGTKYGISGISWCFVILVVSFFWECNAWSP